MPKKSKHDSCTLWFCNEKHYSRGLCARHYQNWLRKGDPLQSEDLRAILGGVEDLKAMIQDFINTAFNGRMMCQFCGAYTPDGEQIKHQEYCLVLKAQEVIDDTTTTPPVDGHTYEIKLGER